MRWILFWMLLLAATPQTSVNALDMTKLKAPFSAEMTPLELYCSPIQPGGKYGLTVNLGNLLKQMTGKFKDRVKLLDKYAKALIECDEELIRLRNDPTPEKGFWKKYKALKAQKLAELKKALIERYGHDHAGQEGKCLLPQVTELSAGASDWHCERESCLGMPVC